MPSGPDTSGATSVWDQPAPTGPRDKPRVTYARRGVSQPLRSLTFTPPEEAPTIRAPRVPELPGQRRAADKGAIDPVRQVTPGEVPNAVELSFDGNGNAENISTLGFGLFPPDTTGDVGPNHYVQWINLVFSVYGKDGTLQFGPAPGNLPWTGFGGPCETNNDGDIIVLYDQLADRWVFSQFAIGADGHQCFAISQTPDPLGSYFLYDFVLSPGGLNDYPKVGLWPDGYYVSFNDFAGAFRSAVVVALDRESMLMGLPAAAVQFDVFDPSGMETYFTVQPSHLEGLATPPPGSPNIFSMAFDDETFSFAPDPAQDSYRLWAFQADWTDPEESLLLGPFSLATDEFDANMCDFSRDCIPQPGTTARLDALAQFTMYRAVFRQLPDRTALLLNHTVDADGASTAGIRWTELANVHTLPEVRQSGTYAPGDGLHRWMGSAAMDAAGNIGLGYSVSSDSVFPSLRITGRLAGDPLGVMTMTETELVTGNSSQEITNRWGDYATMSVDETDGCTFWFTGEYHADGDWKTRVGTFSFPTCTAAEVGRITGTVTSTEGGPIQGAIVRAGALSTATDAAGNYSLLVPAGTYDVEARAFGFVPAVATGVTVGADEVVVLDFALAPAPSVGVSGFVYDGTAAGWPLYAKLTVTAPGAPTQTVFTDPETGFYQLELLGGADYQVSVASIVPGYVSETRPITPGLGDISANFALEVNTGTCEAPGYERAVAPLAFEGFEGAFPPAGWAVEDASTGCFGVAQWTDTDPGFRGNLTGGAGKFAVADSDACGPSSVLETNLVSPPLDLSALGPDEGLLVTFNHDYFDLNSTAVVEVFDGAEWVTAADFSRRNDRGPKRVEVGSDAANGAADARVRWRYRGEFAWWWQVDEVSIATASCDYVGGGLVVGNVTDEVLGEPVNGATVASSTGEAVTSFATPQDPAIADGFYILFVDGPRTVTASKAGYGEDARLVIPQFNGVRRVDFALPVGLLTLSPELLVLRTPFGTTDSGVITLHNVGTYEADFRIGLVDGPPMLRPEGPFAPTGRRTSPKQVFAPTAEHVRVPFVAPDVALVEAGDVVARFDAVTGAWGVGYDADRLDIWVGSIAALGGDDAIYRYLSDGTFTGDSIAADYTDIFAADLAYNARTGTLWQVNVGGEDCIHELDPVARVATGATVCPEIGVSQRGLAYDPVTDTFYAGSWNDGVIHQFDAAGAILRSVNVGLDVSGLAYNASTGHLFIMTNSSDAAGMADIYVADAAAPELDLVGAFDIFDGVTPAFGDFEQAGLELDCDGNLVAINQATAEVVIAGSGEPGSCAPELPGLTVSPVDGVVPAGGFVDIVVTVDGVGIVPGTRIAQLVVNTSSPFPVPPATVIYTIAFLDVAATNPFDAYIHALSGAGVTAGCGGGYFCPSDGITRAEMTYWLLNAKFGPGYEPPPATGLMFEDVSPETDRADYIEEAAALGISTGCGGARFCPNQVVKRNEAAVWILRALEGGDYVPPPAEGLFDDVPDDPFAPWIDELARRGIAIECRPNDYCPNRNMRRQENAGFVVRAFELPMYLP